MQQINHEPVVFPVQVPAPFPLHTNNFYLVQNNTSLFLVDAGVQSKASWEMLEEALKKMDSRIDDIEAIVLTHSHNDHTGLIHRIREKKDIPIYAHEQATKRLKREESFL